MVLFPCPFIQGDGRIDERVVNATFLSDDDLRGDISQHPQLYMFQGVMVALFVGSIITGLGKGYVTVYM